MSLTGHKLFTARLRQGDEDTDIYFMSHGLLAVEEKSVQGCSEVLSVSLQPRAFFLSVYGVYQKISVLCTLPLTTDSTDYLVQYILCCYSLHVPDT